MYKCECYRNGELKKAFYAETLEAAVAKRDKWVNGLPGRDRQIDTKIFRHEQGVWHDEH